jgi:hypothetical protein
MRISGWKYTEADRNRAALMKAKVGVRFSFYFFGQTLLLGQDYKVSCPQEDP